MSGTPQRTSRSRCLTRTDADEILLHVAFRTGQWMMLDEWNTINQRYGLTEVGTFTRAVDSIKLRILCDDHTSVRTWEFPVAELRTIGSRWWTIASDDASILLVGYSSGKELHSIGMVFTDAAWNDPALRDIRRTLATEKADRALAESNATVKRARDQLDAAQAEHEANVAKRRKVDE
jgi:hypothetical protein